MARTTAPLLAELLKDARIRSHVNPRAKRISLRVDVAEGCVVLVRPTRASDKLVASFLADHTGWVEKHLSTLPARRPVHDGMSLTILGTPHVVRSRSTAKRGVWIEGDVIYVSGAPEHMPRRLKDFLKDHAKRIFTDWARDFAAQLDVKVARVAVRDTTTRWGSCTRDGNLSLSWRLVFAPADVAHYVVAHEVAHLKHMNHSALFWRTVESLRSDMKMQRSWLQRHGAQLHRII